jgi:hypothetical protein
MSIYSSCLQNILLLQLTLLYDLITSCCKISFRQVLALLRTFISSICWHWMQTISSLRNCSKPPKSHHRRYIAAPLVSRSAQGPRAVRWLMCIYLCISHSSRKYTRHKRRYKRIASRARREWGAFSSRVACWHRFRTLPAREATLEHLVAIDRI